MCEIEIQIDRDGIDYPEIQDCGHAHIGDCPFEDELDYNEYRKHMKSSCGSYICCIN